MVKRKKKAARRRIGGDFPLQIETVDIQELQPHPDNVRLHGQDNLEAIARSLQEFGQRTPIVVWNDYIIKGNGTWIAAGELLDWSTIQIVRANHLSEEHAKAYAIADNKTSDMSEFDFEKLADQLRELEASGVDLALTGMRDFEIEPLLDAEFRPDSVDDDIPLDPEMESRTITFSPEQWVVVEERVTEALEEGFLSEEEMTDSTSALAVLVMLCSKRMKANKGTAPARTRRKTPAPGEEVPF
jgi:ParB-like chromosome segregation protein Spo0J